MLILLVLVLFTGCGNEISETADNTSELPKAQKETKKDDFTFTNKIPAEGLTEKLDTLDTKEIHTGTSFAIMVYPFDIVSAFMSNLPDYYNKRYSDAKIAQKYKSLKQEPYIRNKISFVVGLAHIGGYNDSSSISIDNNFYEYFFLENENGEYVQAYSQEFVEFNSMMPEIDWLNPNLVVYVSFPEDEVEQLMQEASKLYITFDGLDILPENRIELRYPFINYYLEAFPELESMVEEMEAYKP